jgi:hypothetical protein
LAVQSPVKIDLNMGAQKRIGLMTDLPKNPFWWTQFLVLLRRNFQEQIRSSQIILTSIIQTIIIAVLIGCAFLQIGMTQSSTLRRSPVIFFCAINQGIFGALMVINSFPVARALSLRERATGSYFASTYFTAKVLADTLVQAPVSIIFVSEMNRANVFIVCFFFSFYSHVYCLFSGWTPIECWQIFYFHIIYSFVFFCCNIIGSDDISIM